MLKQAEASLIVNDPCISSFVYYMMYDEPGDFGLAASLGWLDQYGVLEAGVVLHNYHPRFKRVELSAASVERTWMTISRLSLIADYVFNRLDCYTLLAHYDPSNRVARRLWKRIGGHEFILPNLRGPGKGECINVLTADEARQSKFWRL